MKHNNIKELSIQVNLNGLSFCILNRTSNTIEYLNYFPFEVKLNPFDALNRLKTELSTNTIFSDEFRDVTIIHQNELSSLVPKALFDENNKADYLKFNAKILKTDYLTHDDVVSNDSCNVYVPYVNFNNYIFETFGEFVFKHSSTLLIDTVLQQNKTNEDPQVVVNVNSNFIEVLVVENQKLQLFNTFEYTTKEDFIYYILFVYEQLQLDVETTKIQVLGSINHGDDLYAILYTYIRHVEIIPSQFNYKFAEGINTEHLHHHYLILNSF